MDSSIAFEAVSIDTSVKMTANIDFEGIGISILNRGMHEMMYISFRGLELRYVDTQTSYSASVNCKWIQMDNQLFGGLYPIVLYPSVLPKDGKDLESHPTLQASVIVLKDESELLPIYLILLDDLLTSLSFSSARSVVHQIVSDLRFNLAV